MSTSLIDQINAIDTTDILPGEIEALTYEAGRGPITEQEALGVARRHARKELASARRNVKLTVPDALPDADVAKGSYIFRLSPRTIAFVRARAELEGRTMTDVAEAAFAAYAAGVPTAPVA